MSVPTLSAPPARSPIASIRGAGLAILTDWATWFTQVYRAGLVALNTAYFSQTASKTVADTVTETTLLSTGQGLTTLRANQLQPGTRVRVTALGFMSDTGTPTLNLRLKLGGSTLMSTGAVALAGTISNRAWSVDAEFACRTFGATGTVIGQGLFCYDDSTSAGRSEGMVMTAAATVDTTAELALDVTAQWGAASASNTITCTNVSVEVIG